jgi:hypothetical protein
MFTLRTMMSQGFTSGGLIRQSIRPYSKYKVALLKSTSTKDSIDKLKKVNFFDNNPSVLKIATSTEFALNRFLKGKLEPITKDFYMKLRDTYIQQAKELPPGGIFCPGTAAVDLNEKAEDGRKLGVNRGLLIATSTGEFIEWDKQSKSSIDGWPSNYKVITGSKDVSLIIKRLNDVGRDVVITMRTCLDITAGTPFSFEISPDFILSPSFASPLQDREIEASYRGGTVILCDNGNEDLDKLLKYKEEEVRVQDNDPIYIKSGLWDIEQKDIGKFSLLRSSDVLGNSVTGFLHGLFPSLETYRRMVNVYTKTEAMGKYYEEYGIAVSEELKLKDLTKEQMEARLSYPDYTFFYNEESPDNLLQDCKDLAVTLEWDIVDKEVETFIKDHVNSLLSKEDSLLKSVEEWTTEINNNEFNSKLLDVLNLKVYELFVSTGDDRLNKLAEVYKNGLGDLINLAITKNIFDNMTERHAESSFLEDMVRNSVTSFQVNDLSERVSEIQKQQVNLSLSLTATRKELMKREADLARIKEEIATDNENQELVNKSDQLTKEVEAMKNQISQLDHEREGKESEEGKDIKEIEEKRRENAEREKQLEEKRKEVYKHHVEKVFYH